MLILAQVFQKTLSQLLSLDHELFCVSHVNFFPNANFGSHLQMFGIFSEVYFHSLGFPAPFVPSALSYQLLELVVSKGICLIKKKLQQLLQSLRWEHRIEHRNGIFVQSFNGTERVIPY